MKDCEFIEDIPNGRTCFSRMTFVEAAFVLNVSERTVHEDWQMAKMWLFHELPEGTD